jgi:hypothetical protein
MYLLFFGAAFLAHKRNSTFFTACAAGLLTAAFFYDDWYYGWVWYGIVVGLIVGLGKGVVHGVIAEVKADTKEAVSFTVGEVISNNNDTFVTTSVSVGRDVFGEAKATTSNQYHSSHTTWIKDLTTGKEVKIGGDGHLEARSGHVVGFARYKGRTMVDVNYTTDFIYSMKAPNVALQAVLLIIAGLLLGWVLYPVLVLCLSLQSRWPNTFQPKGGGTITAGFAGSAAYDKIYVFGGSLCYGLAVLIPMAGRGSMTSFTIAGLLLFVGIVVLPIYCLVKLRARHAELMIYCKQQLDRIYNEAKNNTAALGKTAQKGEPVIA